MAGRRTYGDACGIARALDVIGERWAILVVRELLLGPKRFTDLRAGLPRLGPDILSQRLRELEEAGVVSRDQLPPPAGSRVYRLTDWGRELEPVVLGLGRWGSRAPFPNGHETLGVDAFMLALKTLYHPARADGLIGTTYEIRLAGQPFEVRPTDTQLDIAHGSVSDPLATIEADPATLQAILWHGSSLDDALAAGRLTITGGRAAAARLLGLFPIGART
ncbi:MAG TPA: winged helix-turn-helix transcriptional regulator [Solirubrobacteraceae bacterium]|nr:winged helix-turn-helix transcriptional regulator [Solirubrobacteraceae bacterium]